MSDAHTPFLRQPNVMQERQQRRVPRPQFVIASEDLTAHDGADSPNKGWGQIRGVCWLAACACLRDGFEVAAVDGGYVARTADGAGGERAAPASSAAAAPKDQSPASTVLAGTDDAIDQAAHEAATRPSNDRPEPSDAQREAGNFKKGHIRIPGWISAWRTPRDRCAAERLRMAPSGSAG
jgi:hypothetical protein